MKIAGAIGEQDEQDRRRQSKAGPSRGGAEIACAHETDGKADLARCRTGQKLAKRHQIGIGAFVEPAPPHDKFVAEIADMGDRPAEAA